MYKPQQRVTRPSNSELVLLANRFDPSHERHPHDQALRLGAQGRCSAMREARGGAGACEEEQASRSHQQQLEVRVPPRLVVLTSMLTIVQPCHSFGYDDYHLRDLCKTLHHANASDILIWFSDHDHEARPDW